MQKSQYNLQCKRRGMDMAKMRFVITDCKDFIKQCIEMIECMMNEKPCGDPVFGQETAEGFPTNLTIYKDFKHCYHWGASLIKGGIVYCRAFSQFQFDGRTFCESYSEVSSFHSLNSVDMSSLIDKVFSRFSYNIR